MDNIYKKLLDNIDMYIIVTDLNNNIIYKNNNFAYELFCSKNNKLNEIEYKNRIFSIDYTEVDNYKIYSYNDITKYKLEINKLKRDYLTNLYNRFAILEKLEELKDKKYSLIIGDIDYFKKINDNYGHLVGDYVLKGISDLLVKSINNKGIIGRYGGEEFIIIVPYMELNEAYNLIEKIRKLIKKTKIKVKYNDCIKEFYVSMTFGMTYNNLDKNIKELISEADKALYQGKNNGRNQTNIYKKNED